MGNYKKRILFGLFLERWIMESTEQEQKRLARIDAKILPLELKELPKKKTWLDKLKSRYYRWKNSKKKYIIPDVGRAYAAVTFDPRSGEILDMADSIHPDYMTALTKPRGEVIEPGIGDSVEDICGLMSQAACDHEFARVIVYPIPGEIRKQVLNTLESSEGRIRYPMYEYRPANLVNNDDLDSRSIIYKYYKQSHVCKPI